MRAQLQLKGINVVRGLNLGAVAVVLLAGLLVSPMLAVVLAAAGETQGLWQHLASTVLPRYVVNTLVLMLGVGLVSLAFGVSSAWVVSRHEFPGRRAFEWLLLLPAAVPAYLVAYTYVDFLEYAGPVQGAFRSLFGWQSARDYWFPEIRSIEGAMLVMGAVLYPYVYLMSRTAFHLTPASLYETGLVNGRNLFWSVALPIARPAIIAGLALVLMETISDFGTVEYFAVETLTLGIFNVWLGMNNLAAAAQIALVAFVFIVALLVIEAKARAKRRYANTTRRHAPLAPQVATGWRAVACLTVCLTPIFAGFVLPVGVLIYFVIDGQSQTMNEAMVRATYNSVWLAGAVAGLVMSTAALMGLISRYNAWSVTRRGTELAALGYAFPGTILAIGVVTIGGVIDAALSESAERLLGLSIGGWLTTSMGLVVFACVVRFQAIGYGAVTSGIGRVPHNLFHASRTLGRTTGQSLRDVIVPLLLKSILAGGLLVFVDVMKELPMTLLLRPFNFETLATYVYQFAKDELLEEAALPALLIILAGLPPVLIMNLAVRRISR